MDRRASSSGIRAGEEALPDWRGHTSRRGGTISVTTDGRDEAYIINLCDHVIGIAAQRQHRFPFLTGDPGKRGICRSLPIDAYYPALCLAVEYRERQHSEAVPFMDRRPTISGCSRGEQRRRYDQRRRVVLPQHGIRLVELDYRMFAHDSRKRLRRGVEADEAVIRAKFANLA